MLSDKEKQHLKAEEIFRQEIRREIEARVPNRSRRAKLWQAINTPFILWVLSSILLASFGWVFSTCQASRDVESQNVESIRKLDTEIGNRIQGALMMIGAQQRSSYPDAGLVFRIALAALDRRDDKV